MNVKKGIIISLIFLIIIGLGSFLGTKVKRNQYIEKEQVFPARIREINEEYIKIKGLDSNEKDFRNKWFVIPLKNTKLRWKDEKIKLIHLNEGDLVSISFTGEATETYPITINNIKKLELLESEKTRRLIKIENKLYYDTKKISENTKEHKIEGTITNTVKRSEIPKENNTSNFSNNICYQKIEENKIEVLIENEWIIFEQKEIQE